MAPRPRESHTGDIRDEDLFLRQPIKDIEDKWHLVPAFLKTRGFIKTYFLPDVARLGVDLINFVSKKCLDFEKF